MLCHLYTTPSQTIFMRHSRECSYVCGLKDWLKIRARIRDGVGYNIQCNLSVSCWKRGLCHNKIWCEGQGWQSYNYICLLKMIQAKGGWVVATANQTTQWQTSLSRSLSWSSMGRLHRRRQAFPWHPSQSTRGQTTQITDKLYPGTSLMQSIRGQTTPIHKAFFPWCYSQSTSGDRLYKRED